MPFTPYTVGLCCHPPLEAVTPRQEIALPLPVHPPYKEVIKGGPLIPMNIRSLNSLAIPYANVAPRYHFGDKYQESRTRMTVSKIFSNFIEDVLHDINEKEECIMS